MHKTTTNRLSPRKRKTKPLPFLASVYALYQNVPGNPTIEQLAASTLLDVVNDILWHSGAQK